MYFNGVSACGGGTILVELPILDQMFDCITEAMALLCCVAVIIMISTVLVASGSSGLFWIPALGWWGNEIFVPGPYVLICGGQGSVDFIMRWRGGTTLLLWRALVPRLIWVVAVSLSPMATVGATPLFSGWAMRLPFFLPAAKVLIWCRGDKS